MTEYEEGYELGSIVRVKQRAYKGRTFVTISDEVLNPYKDGTKAFYNWWKGFNQAVEDRIS